MNELCVDLGYLSLTKQGEELCGDHVESIEQDDGLLMVLADGLGSGVKANILSTLTAKMIATMLSQSLSIDECISAMACALPICSERKIAYSTFTVIRVIDNREAEIIQYDNPKVILLRDGKNTDYPTQSVEIDGKRIHLSRLALRQDDVLMCVSDGAIYAGVGPNMNFQWQRQQIIDFMELIYDAGSTAKTLATLLSEQLSRLYDGRPGDDTTVCALKVRRRQSVNVLMGPPDNPADQEKMFSLFFSKEGKRIICGGTTSSLAASYLGETLDRTMPLFRDPDIPPTAKLVGVDLVTEGLITMKRVLEYARDYLGNNQSYATWGYHKDGASLIASMLLEQATDINFFIGCAINPAHQNPKLPSGLNIKIPLIKELSQLLRQMGKRVTENYF